MTIRRLAGRAEQVNVLGRLVPFVGCTLARVYSSLWFTARSR